MSVGWLQLGAQRFSKAKEKRKVVTEADCHFDHGVLYAH